MLPEKMLPLFDIVCDDHHGNQQGWMYILMGIAKKAGLLVNWEMDGTGEIAAVRFVIRGSAADRRSKTEPESVRQAVADLLSPVMKPHPSADELRKWSPEEIKAAADWAVCEHLAAQDARERLPKPACVERWEQNQKRGHR